MSATLLASAGRILARLIERNGINPEGIFSECGLDPLKLRTPRARYPVDRIRAAWRLADRQIDTPCWGLQAGELWQPTDFHALGYAFFAGRTLRAAMHRLCRYHAVVVQDVRVEIDEREGALVLNGAPPDADEEVVPLQDARTAVWASMCRKAYGEDLRLLEVTLNHPCRPCAYEAYFGCPVRFEASRNAIAFPLAAVERYLPAQNRDQACQSDAHLHALLRTLTEQSMTERVRRAVLDALPSGRASAIDIGHAWGMRRRTLQRKLQDEGTTFDEVIEGVRKELAQRYVRSGEYDLLEVTYLMGLSTLSAFSRAYKTWTGRAPSEDLPGA